MRKGSGREGEGRTRDALYYCTARVLGGAAQEPLQCWELKRSMRTSADFCRHSCQTSAPSKITASSSRFRHGRDSPSPPAFRPHCARQIIPNTGKLSGGDYSRRVDVCTSCNNQSFVLAILRYLNDYRPSPSRVPSASPHTQSSWLLVSDGNPGIARRGPRTDQRRGRCFTFGAT